ncbi:MAG: hypothetical protein K2X90_00360 [Candidatus Babeliaceae bacterium]|nr:hypothetical protein [Candidatus Babeliaceae bacterium]
MKLRILFVLTITVFQAWAIKESSKLVLINNVPTAWGFSHTKQKIQDIPLSASADKYADVLLQMAKDLARHPMGPAHAYPELAAQMCELVEKLAIIEKVSHRKLEKARMLKEKYTRLAEKLKRAQELQKESLAPYKHERVDQSYEPPVQHYLLPNRRF